MRALTLLTRIARNRSWKSSANGRLGWGSITTLLMLGLCTASALLATWGPEEYHTHAIGLVVFFFVATAVVGASAGKDSPPSEGL